MSIQLNKLAAEFNRYFTSSNGVDVPAKVSVSRDEWRALFTAIQQAESEPVEPDTLKDHQIAAMVNTLRDIARQFHGHDSLRERIANVLVPALKAETQQPVTGEPVQADSSEYLRVIASLGAALRRLSFAAQTTGGTAGPDAELQSAIGQAEQALSLGGIGQAMFATPEPVADVRCEGCGYMTHHREHMGCVRAAKQHIHPRSRCAG